MWAFRLRCFALLGAGGFALHELRYVLAYGDASGAVLRAQGHAYLDAVAAVVALALVAACAGLLAAVLRRRGATTTAPRWRSRWPLASGALLGVYAAQELVEGALSPGHPAGLVGVFGHGGWIAVPLALLLGALVAALLRGADAVLARFAVAPPRLRIPRAPRLARPRAPLSVRLRPAAALAGPGAGRAPPLLGR